GAVRRPDGPQALGYRPCVRIVAGEADVVREGVEPDVGDELVVERQLDSPIESRFWSRDAKITAQLLDRIAQFGLPKIGNDGGFAIVDVAEQPVFVPAQFEIVIFFLAELDLSPLGPELAIRAAFFVGEKLFLAD